MAGTFEGFKGIEIERYVEVSAGTPRYALLKYYPYVTMIDIPILLLAWWLAELPFDPNDVIFMYGFVPALIFMFFATIFGYLIINAQFSSRIDPIIIFTEGLEMRAPAWLRIRGFSDFMSRADIERLTAKYYTVAQSRNVVKEMGYCAIVLRNGKTRSTGLQTVEKIERFTKVVHDKYGVPVEGAKWSSKPEGFAVHQATKVRVATSDTPSDSVNHFCGGCGTRLLEGAAFCGKCGRKV